MNDGIPMRITIPFDRWVILSCFRYNNPPIRVLMPIIFLIIAQRLKVWMCYKTMIIRSCSLANKRRIKNDTVCHLCLLPSLFIFFLHCLHTCLFLALFSIAFDRKANIAIDCLLCHFSKINNSVLDTKSLEYQIRNNSRKRTSTTENRDRNNINRRFFVPYEKPRHQK